ncbi:hypothetical protein UPYG_G00013730 [Umbra pygmaea]|uniref:Mitochondrial ribosome-associated GTPase 2 n=1 Tax=Umbra pygmaea TaxID=75934 RepID=A0ABD0XXX7_UMBPY
MNHFAMLTTFAKVQTRIRLVQEMIRIFANVKLTNKLTGSWLATRETPLIRTVATSCLVCAKSREISQKKELSEKKLTRHFVDHRNVKLQAGAGGKGACTFHSEPRKEWGGPDGGNGGDGGNIIIKVDRQVKSLAQVDPVYKGEDGDSGGSKNCYGRNAGSTYIAVPLGTVVKEQGNTVADLSQHGQEYVAAFGGAGGKGNRFFLSNENRAPMTATPGERGQERVLHLELRTMAHAGLVGFPNAGKSSLLRAISNARPAVAAYPFTTLNPHVGIVKYRDHEQVAVADIPGIIRGAHLNRGLGISFLRHIERCRFLLFVLDLSTPEPWTQLQYLRYELDQYESGLSLRPHAIVANKMDLPGSKANLEALRSHVDHRVIPVSALTGQNTEELILHLRELYDGYLQTEIQGSGEDKLIRCFLVKKNCVFELAFDLCCWDHTDGCLLCVVADWTSKGCAYCWDTCWCQHVRRMDNESDKWAGVLWEYLCLHQPLEKSDVIIGLGCHDVRVAERSAALFLEGWAPWLLFTGYLGKQTADVWTRPEADVFLDVALKMGVPRENILLETKATNTGENICFSYRILKENNIPARKLILVQQPFMERRVFATFLRQWPDQGDNMHTIVTSPEIGISGYPNPTVGTTADLIMRMLGVLERIRDYPQKGFQVEQEITHSALTAYHWLLQAGYIPK